MEKKKNILVTGANGQLGREIRALAAGDRNHYVFSDISRLPGEETLYLDITNKEAVALTCRSERIDVIVNCAAYTDVEKAEDDPAMAGLLNRDAVANLAEIAAAQGIVLLHISTDYIFQGNVPRPIREDWPAAPLGTYGVTKLQGEQAIFASGCRYLIFRTAWLYSPYGKNFVKTMVGLTKSRPRIKVVSDQIGTPTYAADLAGLIVRLIAGNHLEGNRIFHYTDEGVCSWYDFACAIRDLCGGTAEIVPCSSEEYPSKARRPLYSVLDKTAVKQAFGIEIPHWYASLKKCMERL